LAAVKRIDGHGGGGGKAQDLLVDRHFLRHTDNYRAYRGGHNEGTARWPKR
jgi:hypothetical protein